MDNDRNAQGIESITPGQPLAAAWLNKFCLCVSLDSKALRRALSQELCDPAIFALVEQRLPYLFSAQPIFLSDVHAQRMAQVIDAVESVVASSAYRTYVLSQAPAIAGHNSPGARGVFFGYDFHVAGDEIGLIEVNTNAGGAMLNAVMARAHRACCLDTASMEDAANAAARLEAIFVDMFQQEWQRSGRADPLRTIAIVDAQPAQQYLYPEFLLFQRLFDRHGLRTVIADPDALEFRQGSLWHGDIAIDLVYNRLTDFALTDPTSAALRAAYLDNAVVLTPHPQAHALYADKRNLAVLSDAQLLQEFGVPEPARSTLLSNIPATQLVTPERADSLWEKRRQFFFKPVAGFGSRATYRGDKLTRRVWEEILSGDYVAQAIMAPGERTSGTADAPQQLKFDIRCYVYDGKVQWTAARLYQGQTTNFRTMGGGFAPVYSLPDYRVLSDDAALLQNAMDALACCASACAKP